jgi:hypothetical protein
VGEKQMKFTEDLKDRVFDRLTVKRQVPPLPKQRGLCWECECRCGNKKIVPAARLIKKMTRSCGCLVKEIASANAKKRRRLNYDKIVELANGMSYAAIARQMNCSRERIRQIVSESK